MTATDHGHATAFLHRAGLIAGILAIIAGIFGMHIMTGNHTMHGPAAVAVTTGDAVHAGAAAPHGHADHQAAGSPAGHQASDVQDAGVGPAESCSCSGDCTRVQAASETCVPSSKSASLAAPLPGTAVLAFNFSPSVASTVTGHYSYLPGSPSPGELSISRT